jgi:acyl-CoA thioesterase-1
MRDIFPQRHSSRLLLGVMVMLAVGCGATETPAPPQTADSGPRETATPRPAGEPFRIVFLGDSLSAGFGLPESAASTAGGLARLDWVLRSRPHVLVVELGGNDALRGQSLENTERNLREIVRRGRDAGADVLLLGMDVPTNYGADYGGEFAALYQRIAKDEQVALLPGFMREVGMNRRLMLPDGLHPTAEGHRLLADSLVQAIQGMLPS